MAIGCRWAACSRRTALAETSRMQCFPWGRAGWAEGGRQGAGKDRQRCRDRTQDTGRGKVGDGRLAKGAVMWM